MARPRHRAPACTPIAQASRASSIDKPASSAKARKLVWAHYQGGDVDAGLAELEAPAGALIDDLLWWSTALKTARASAS